ncbi:hypothetical protein L682_29555 [Aquipseudomonas alcaligenes OT 69]|nr:hypothetical protein L682_29555 [Pseudomonas alcaligenes OT 69]
MPRKTLIGCALISLLIVSGCSSRSVVRPVAMECPSPPAPPAWMMEPVTPNFTPRLQVILPPSPEMQTAVP